MLSKEISNIKLNEKQNYAYSLMAAGKSVFITGPGGVGKSALIKLFTRVYQKSRIIAVTSTTGTSALLLNGTTFHSYLGIGYGDGHINILIQKIYKLPWLRKRWTELDCLIIDEISMMNPELFDKLEEIARVIRKNKEPFGGMQIILSGDFCQLPVVGSDKFCFEAKTWDKCIEETIYLKEIIRQKNLKFQSLLNNIRIGNITTDTRAVLDSHIGKKLVNDFGIKPTRLYSTNVDVESINNVELDKLATKGEEFYEYEMDIYVYPKINNRGGAMEKFRKCCSAPRSLQICVGAQVMLLKNLDLASGLANGSRGVVIKFTQDLPVVKFLNGEERIIDMDIWDVEENDKPILRAKQVPLKVAYAISIHKSQGCSLDFAEIDLSNIFEYGQAYVALSRVKSLEGLSIINIKYDNICAHPKAIEYYEQI